MRLTISELWASVKLPPRFVSSVIHSLLSCEIPSVLDVLGWLESPCTVFRGSFGHVEGLVGLSDQGFEMAGLAIFGCTNADSYPSGIANGLQNFSRLYPVQNLFGDVHCAVKIGVGKH